MRDNEKEKSTLTYILAYVIYTHTYLSISWYMFVWWFHMHGVKMLPTLRVQMRKFQNLFVYFQHVTLM